MSKPFTCSLGTPCYLQAFGAIHPFSCPKKNLHILFTVGLSFLQALRAIASCRSPPLLAACPKPEGDEENSLPWGALVRQRSRLSELPIILYMQWMGLRSKGGILLYIPLLLCLCAFFPISPSCISPLALRSMKYALQLQKANTERSDRRRLRTIRLPDGIHGNEAWVALQNGCVLSENTGWIHQPPSVSLELC